MGTWSFGEVSILRKAYDDGIPWNDLTEALPGRTASMIRVKASRLGLGALDFVLEAPVDQTSLFINRDRAFRRAVMRAIKAGHENPHVGIIKDDTPFVGVRLYGTRSSSICGSAAQMCAEA